MAILFHFFFNALFFWYIITLNLPKLDIESNIQAGTLFFRKMKLLAAVSVWMLINVVERGFMQNIRIF
jgi:hypothetical protein